MSLFISSSKVKLLKRLFRFCFPLIIFLSILYLPFVLTGEILFVKHRIDSILQEDKEYVFGHFIDADQRLRYVKYKQLLITRPEIISIGSSRVLQFRKEMFKKNFYNFGYTVSRIDDTQGYLPLVSKIGVKYIILGLDHWMFNPNWIQKQVSTKNNIKTISSLPFFDLPGPRKLYKHFKEALVSWYSPIYFENYNNLLGLNAFEGNGIRRDGSYLYGGLINKILVNDPTIEDYQFRNTFSRISQKTSRFEKFHSIDESSLKALVEIMQFCNNENIKLVLFMSPVANEVNKKMLIDREYPMLLYLPKVLESLSRKFNVLFLNFPDFHSVGETDSSAIDGFHGSERVYGKILLSIAQNDSSFRKVINSTDLLNQLESKTGFNLYY